MVEEHEEKTKGHSMDRIPQKQSHGERALWMGRKEEETHQEHSTGLVASLVAQMVKNLPAMQERPGFDHWVGTIPWRREWQPTPVFLPGEFHGLYSPWSRKELDTTDFHFTSVIS